MKVGDVMALGDRRVRICGMPDGMTVCRDHRGRVAVRNIETNRLSYVPEGRLLAAEADEVRALIDDLERRLFPFQESEFEQQSFTDVGRQRVAEWLRDRGLVGGAR